MTKEQPDLDWFGHKLDYPMFIVTTEADGERSGCLIGFATQCSIHPPRFAVFISKKNHTFRVLMQASALAVHVVPPDAFELAELFGGTTGDEVDKFERVEWVAAPLGSPRVSGCPNWCEGPIVSSLDAGDHQCFIVEPEHGDATNQLTFLTFSLAKKIEPGHEA